MSLLLLGTLAGSVYPRATLRALPLLWLGSGLGAWLLGDAGTHHLGASGLTHGLMFLVFTLGLLRRDRPAIAAAMIAFFLYGGMLLTVLPQEPGVSWQSHLGGALAGIVAAIAVPPPRPAAAAQALQLGDRRGAGGRSRARATRPVRTAVATRGARAVATRSGRTRRGAAVSAAAPGRSLKQGLRKARRPAECGASVAGRDARLRTCAANCRPQVRGSLIMPVWLAKSMPDTATTLSVMLRPNAASSYAPLFQL